MVKSSQNQWLHFVASAILAVTFDPGRCPPSPGFAPCPILISKRLEELSSSALTPKRPEAIC